MDADLVHIIPRLQGLPATLPVEGAIRIELQEGIPILRASASVQDRVEDLASKRRESRLSREEAEEFDRYEEIDDYLSLLNRLVRNLFQARKQGEN